MKSIIKYLTIILFGVSIMKQSHAQTYENVPYPPKRPDVLNVSPAYIDYLNNKKNNATEKKPEEESSSQPESSLSKENLETVTVNDILSSIENKAVKNKITPLVAPPIPK